MYTVASNDYFIYRRQKAQDSHLKHIKRTEMSISRLEQELEMLIGVKENHLMEIENRSAPVPDIERKIGEMQRSLRETHSLLEGQIFSQVRLMCTINIINRVNVVAASFSLSMVWF